MSVQGYMIEHSLITAHTHTHIPYTQWCQSMLREIEKILYWPMMVAKKDRHVFFFFWLLIQWCSILSYFLVWSGQDILFACAAKELFNRNMFYVRINHNCEKWSNLWRSFWKESTHTHIEKRKENSWNCLGRSDSKPDLMIRARLVELFECDGMSLRKIQ